MRRIAFALFWLPLLSGCIVLEGSRIGQEPNDPDAEAVAAALAAAVPASLDRHTQNIPGWTRDRRGHGTSRGGNGTDWSVHFACLRPGEPDTIRPQRLPAEQFVPMLTPIRVDVMKVLEGVGVEVTHAPPIEFRDGENPRARFEVFYFRNNRTVAGKVTGVLEPAPGSNSRYTDAKVTQQEWVCK